MNSIVCPHCKNEIEISEAMTHQLREEVVRQEAEKHKLELDKARKEAQLQTEKELKEKTQKDLEQSKKEQEKLEQKLAQLQKQQEEAESKRKENEEKFRTEVLKKAEEEQRLKLKEKDLLLEQARKANEDLKRKLEQGSQQAQGEVLELELEDKLKSTFPSDEFMPIPKGVEGGDIWQKVTANGKSVGSILWETKRTKAWSKGWLAKLKDDAARVSASEAIIVSNILPDDIKNFSRIDGIWITTYEHAISVCRYVRYFVARMNSIKSSASKTEEEWGRVRDYMLSDSFVHRMQAHYDVIKTMRDLLEAERRSAQLRWKKQEEQILKLDNNTTSFYAELKSIVKELPDLDGVSTKLLESNEDNEQTLL